MSEKRSLYDVKTALADKYERMARNAGSTPKRETFMVRAVRYRRQAQQIAQSQK